jgi:hypothetical protein
MLRRYPASEFTRTTLAPRRVLVTYWFWGNGRMTRDGRQCEKRFGNNRSLEILLVQCAVLCAAGDALWISHRQWHRRIERLRGNPWQRA